MEVGPPGGGRAFRRAPGEEGPAPLLEGGGVLLLMVALGGAAGAWTRYHASRWIHERTGTGFPWGTLAVNLSGSFILGLLVPLLADPDALAPLGAFLEIGLLGAFTTFSTFAFETVRLTEGGAWSLAVLYVAASLVLGLGAIAGGFLLGSWLL